MNEELSSGTDLNAVIADVMRLVGLIAGDKPRARILLDPALGRIRAAPKLIESVLVSLVTRAVAAAAQGGDLVITTANKNLDDPLAARMSSVSPGTYVQVEFELAGAEIEVPAALRDAATRHKGAVSVHRYSSSMTIAILFPRMSEKNVARAPDREQKLLGPLILLVDDEPGAAELTRRLLDEAGYLVTEASSPEQAQAILNACHVDLVITAGVHEPPPGSDRPRPKAISAAGMNRKALLEAVRRAVGEPRG